MSAYERPTEVMLPTRYGVAAILECDGCGRHEFAASETDRLERMTEFHRTFCDGDVRTEHRHRRPR